MVLLWIRELLALHPEARLDVLESAQIRVVPDVRSNLHDDQSARDEERAPYAVEKKQREQFPNKHMYGPGDLSIKQRSAA